MARKETKADFANLEDEPMAAASFAPQAMPPQQVIDQVASTMPQLSPEDQLAHGQPKLAAPQQRRSSRGVKPMREIIEQFLADVQNHPDAKMFATNIGGRPPKNLEFPGTPFLNQHQATFGIVYRDSVPEAVLAATPIPPSAFAPGGKYYDLIPRKGEQEFVEQPEADSPTAKPWGHLVNKRETVAV